MSFILQPWHILHTAIYGLVNQRQQEIIAFQKAETEALRKKFEHKPPLLNDDRRRYWL